MEDRLKTIGEVEGWSREDGYPSYYTEAYLQEQVDAAIKRTAQEIVDFLYETDKRGMTRPFYMTLRRICVKYGLKEKK